MNSSVSNESLETLLSAYLSGNDAAFPLLESRVRRFLESAVLRRCRNLDADLHQDVVQEVWLAVIRKRELSGSEVYDGSRSAKSFLASFIPNAKQKVAATNRRPGDRSRLRIAAVVVPSYKTVVANRATSLECLEAAQDNALVLTPEDVECRIDLNRLTKCADSTVAAAMALVREDGETLAKAAETVGLSPTTCVRRLRARPMRAA